MMKVAGKSDDEIDPDEELLTDDEINELDRFYYSGPLYPEHGNLKEVRLGDVREAIRRLLRWC